MNTFFLGGLVFKIFFFFFEGYKYLGGFSKEVAPFLDQNGAKKKEYDQLAGREK